MPPLSSKQWKERIARRSDLCGHVTHLTKGAMIKGIHNTSLQVLKKILKEKRLDGSSTDAGFLVGNRRAVCFQDVPLPAIAQNVHYEHSTGNTNSHGLARCSHEGLMFSKFYVYGKGGRPVLYGDKELWKGTLPVDEHWRIVGFDLADERKLIDWTHEREWRVPDKFEFDLSEVTVIVADTKAYRELVSTCGSILKDLAGIVTLSAVNG